MVDLLYAALETPLGLRVRTDERDKLKMRLYAARQKARDPALDALSFICPAHEPDHLWLIRKQGDV